MKFSAQEFLARIPFKTGILAGLLCFVVVEKQDPAREAARKPENRKPPVRFADAEDISSYKVEFYPFSAFPMYGTFSDEPIYNFITDGQDKPLAFKDFSTEGISALKKDYYARLKQIRKERGVRGDIADSALEIKREAGRQTLENLVRVRAASWAADPANKDRVIRLHEAVIRRHADGIHFDTTTLMIAEGSPSNLATPAS